MTVMDTYQQKVEAKLRNWRAEIEKLRAKTNRAPAETKREYDRELEMLSAKWEAARGRLTQIKQTSGKAEVQLKQKLDQTLTGLQQNLEQVKRNMREINSHSLGWAEGQAEQDPGDSEGWVEGAGHQKKDSEGWVQGQGHQEQDSKGWVQGLFNRTGTERRLDVILGDNLIDRPVISVNDGQIVGKVKEFYLDTNLETITAIQLGSSGFFNLGGEGLFHSKHTLIKRDDITLFGLDAILVKNAEVMADGDEVSELDSWLPRHDLQRREVDTPGGTRLGTIGDIVFDKEGQVVAFTFSRVYVEGPLAEAQTFAREVIVDTGGKGKVITIDLAQAEQPDLSVAALEQ